MRATLPAATAAHVSWGTSSEREQLISSAWLELRRNVATHEREVAQAEELGYKAIESLPPPPWEPPAVQSYQVLPTATGMGPACPFRGHSGGESMPLVFETTSPIVSKGEVQQVHMHASANARAHVTHAQLTQLTHHAHAKQKSRTQTQQTHTPVPDDDRRDSSAHRRRQ